MSMIDYERSAELNGCTADELKARFVRFPSSRKKVVAICDVCGIEREREFYAYYDLCHICANNTPEYCEANSKRMIQYYKDHPEAREAARLRGIEQFSDQSVRDEMSEKVKNSDAHKKAVMVRSDNPEWINNQMVGAQKRMDDPMWVQHHDEAMRDEQHNNPRMHDMLRQNIRRYWDEITPDQMLSHRMKQSASMQGISIDEWESFATEQKYCPAFNKHIREQVRAKYDYVCFVCGLTQDENVTKNGENRKLAVHHYDMNKDQGCNGYEWKLVPLCMHCHAFAHNDVWEQRIEYLLNGVKGDING